MNEGLLGDLRGRIAKMESAASADLGPLKISTECHERLLRRRLQSILADRQRGPAQLSGVDECPHKSMLCLTCMSGHLKRL